MKHVTNRHALAAAAIMALFATGIHAQEAAPAAEAKEPIDRVPSRNSFSPVGSETPTLQAICGYMWRQYQTEHPEAEKGREAFTKFRREQCPSPPRMTTKERDAAVKAYIEKHPELLEQPKPAGARL